MRDHDGGSENGRGHEDGVAVDLLHGELGSDDLLLQCVSAWGPREERVSCAKVKPHSHTDRWEEEENHVGTRCLY